MKYYWIITDAHLEDLKEEIGYYDGDTKIKDNQAKFSMYDDDICYYEGIIYGDYDGFEPLDDFGMPNAGCTYIKINGEVL